MHVIGSDSDCILSLCKQFENLLQERDPQLFYHLLQLKLQPLSVAFNWIFHAFVGYLNVEQVRQWISIHICKVAVAMGQNTWIQ